MYSIKEVAALLEVSEITVRRAIECGKLPAVKIMSTWRIAGKDLLDMLARARLSAAATRQARAARKDKTEAVKVLKEIYARYPDLVAQLIQRSPALRQLALDPRPMRRRPGGAIRQLKSSG